jgi:hypothetical protein
MAATGVTAIEAVRPTGPARHADIVSERHVAAARECLHRRVRIEHQHEFRQAFTKAVASRKRRRGRTLAGDVRADSGDKGQNC